MCSLAETSLSLEVLKVLTSLQTLEVYSHTLHGCNACPYARLLKALCCLQQYPLEGELGKKLQKNNSNDDDDDDNKHAQD